MDSKPKKNYTESSMFRDQDGKKGIYNIISVWKKYTFMEMRRNNNQI
jgi:hypothetical protein